MVEGNSDVFIKKPAFCNEDKDCPGETPICKDEKICVECRGDQECKQSTKPFCDTRMAICIEDVEYSKIVNKRCSSSYGYFSSVADAKESCAHDSSCGGVYDDECDESPNDIHLCVLEYEYRDASDGSCVFDKKVIYCRQDSECKDESRPYCFDNNCVGKMNLSSIQKE